jgi:uroporphyrinogen-III synthase
MKILYLGLDPSRYRYQGELTHLPIIKIVPRPFDEKMKAAFEQLSDYSHVIFTSRSAVSLYKEYALKAGCWEAQLQEKNYICVGKATATSVSEHGLIPNFIAKEETAEGMAALLATLDLRQARFFFPRSAQGRTVLFAYFIEKSLPFFSIDLYDTIANEVQIPNLEDFDEIVFTSPSTVKAFFDRVHKSSVPAKCRALGPITEKFLHDRS